MNFFYTLSKHVLIASLVLSPVLGYAGSVDSFSNVCPGDSRTVHWSSSNVLGSCTNSYSTISCNLGTITPNTTGSSILTPTDSCTFGFTCYGTVPASSNDQAQGSISINPAQSGCCGTLSLINYTDWNGSICTNPRPTINISPTAQITIPLGDSVTFHSTTTDTSSDIVIHNLTWEKPNGEDRYAGTEEQGTVTYSDLTSFVSGATTSSQTATFTPDRYGYYRVRFAVQDNAINNYNNYNGEGPRWTYSQWVTVAVVEGTSASITQGSNTVSLTWNCTNSDRATLVTTNGATSTDFTDLPLPPNSGTFTIPKNSTSTYTITCSNTTTGRSATRSFTPPSIENLGAGVSDITLLYDCKNPLVQSSSLQRSPGAITITNSTSSTVFDTGLQADTDYDYTLRCFSGLNGQGSRLGIATLRATTLASSSLAGFTIGAYIQSQPTDPANYATVPPIMAVSPDGGFYQWSYIVTGATSTSCTMQTRSDTGGWSAPYASDPSTYTLSWTDLTEQDKLDFIASFSQYRYWKLTCFDEQSRSSTLSWGIQKTNNYPTVLGAVLNTSCTPPITTSLDVSCTNSDGYEVRDVNTNTLIASGTTANATVPLPGPGTYSTICKLGSLTSYGRYHRTVGTSLCTTVINSFTATPRTIRSGGIITLQWNISSPTSTCSITSSPVCAGTCSQERIDESNEINNRLFSESTDANDRNNLNGEPRTILDALRSEAFNNAVTGKALGKKSFHIKYTTDFLLQCPGTPAAKKIQVQVSNDREG
jgi:hypothetical protein